MTCRLVTPWWINRHSYDLRAVPDGSVAETRTLDLRAEAVQDLVSELGVGDSITRLRQAHGIIAARVRPVYAVDDGQPVSKTLSRGRGSCSQRLAVLEAVSRAMGVPTRVRGLMVDGAFWYPRFPHVRFAVPDAVILAWPEFQIDDSWVSISELFGPIAVPRNASGFSNAAGETLFDAVSRTSVDWDGATSTPEACSVCDLSAQVMGDLGRFDSRDELFAEHGQTLCWGVRTLAGPVLGRWSAGTARTE